MRYKFSDVSVVDLSKVLGMKLENMDSYYSIVLYFANNQMQVNFYSDRGIDPDWTAEKARKFSESVYKEYEDVCKKWEDV